MSSAGLPWHLTESRVLKKYSMVLVILRSCQSCVNGQLMFDVVSNLSGT